jgi:hypothetical protein
MKIDMGNFGNAQREVVNNQVNRGNPAEMAEAKINSARNTQQQETRVNQAWEQVGQQAQQLGGEIWQQTQQLAAQKGAASVQDYQIHRQGVIQSAQDKIDSGDLKAAGVKDYIQKGMEEFKRPEIDSLSPTAKMQVEKGYQSVDLSANTDSDHLFRAAHKIETRTFTDDFISKNERIALNGGPDVSQAAAQYDSEGFIASAREAYGADYQKVLNSAKGNLWKASALNQVLNNRDSYDGLNKIGQAITDENGLYHGKLDPDSQLAIMGQIETRKTGLEAKAIAEQTRQQAAAARAETHQAHVDQVAYNTLQQAEDFQASNPGATLSPDYLENISQKLQGSAYAGGEKQLAYQNKQLVEFSGLTAPQQNAWLTERAAQLSQSDDPAAQKQYNLLKSAADRSQAERKADPITAQAKTLQQDIPALPFDVVGKGSTWQEKQQNMQTFSAALYQRKALYDSAKMQDPSISPMFLTKDEQTAFAKQLKDSVPAERVKMIADLQNYGGKYGPELVKQIGATKSDQVAAWHMSSDPNGEAATLIVGGQTLRTAKGANYKAPPTTKTQPLIDSTYGGAMTPTMRNTVGTTFNDAYIQYRADKNEDPNTFDSDDYAAVMEKVAGKVIQYGASGKIAVPPSTDENQFRDKLYSSIKALPDGVNINANLQTGDATLTAVGGSSYLVTQPNGAPLLGSQTHQPIYITVN